ncbi:MAG: hypothetical protein WBG38_12880 [Nodosilinea sp.]
MTLIRGYLLVFDLEPPDRDDAYTLETALQYPVFVASSTAQAVPRVNKGVPGLVILVSNNVQA